MLFIKRFYKQSLFAGLCMFYTYLPVSYAQTTGKISIIPAEVELNQLIRKVLPTHPRFIAAQAELQAARALYSASTNAIYNPELEVDTEETNIRTSTIGLRQTIDWGDQQGANTQIAKFQFNAAKENFKQERHRLISDLLIIAGDYKNKARLAALSNQRLTLMKDFYSLAKQKHSAGDLNQVELDLAQLAYSESIFDNARVLSEYTQEKQNFYAMFAAVAETTLPEIPRDFQKVSLPAELDSFLMTLPKVQKMRATVAANKNIIALRQAESSADPSVAIRGGKEDKESLVGVTLTIPINIRNNFTAEIKAAEQDYLQSEQLAQQAWRNLRRDIISQTRHYELTRNAWQQWRLNGQASIQRQLSLLKQLWRTGDLSTTDYLVQIKQNLDTQSASIELHTTLWKSWLMWLDSTAQIETWLQLNFTRNQ